jgi:rhomboid family GlyGly-CTERM serine protease
MPASPATGLPQRAPRPGRAWLGVALALALGSVVVWLGPWPAERFDWQPGLAGSQPWRWWSAAWVHGSAGHLGANLAGTVLVAVLGLAACLPTRLALAWVLAWPLTQLAWLLGPPLAHFGGASGVLHAGVAVAALHLLRAAPGRRRIVGALLLAGLVLKLVQEAPWGPALRQVPGWDVLIAPWSHASGVLAGLLAAALLGTGRRGKGHIPIPDAESADT